MELHQLRYFVAVAHEGSFTAAAARLYLSQPSLSVQIRKLERDVGARLFERTGRQVVLTAAGSALLEHAQVALDQLERGRQRVAEVSGVREGEVRVGVLPSIGARMLPEVLAEFRRAHPRVEVRIVEHDVSREFEQLVRSGELDLAITRMPLTLSGLCTDVLVREPVLLLVPAGHRLAGVEQAALLDLAGEEIVGMRTGYGLRDLADQLLAEAGVAPRVVLETGQLAIVHGMVAAGMGVALLPRLAAGDGLTVPLADPCAVRELGVVSRSSAHVSPPVQAFRRSLLRTARG
ncbi:DNA-binding transcriptional LysR family regulator [Pseudonocardia sediminis]|uniref:DNA-binding transcriptional LysR family regulator n=1 Tax=Pseudonocardia sediminis TaxID=1397368 RepID=A0A4Q7V2T2_PSEST|nr:LysR family transcriptional regulator [Pseudonocardia sediminis]RZT86953.1 DNA-binding transcriptional LysR family regulator [Pseudonocardia sediminis]